MKSILNKYIYSNAKLALVITSFVFGICANAQAAHPLAIGFSEWIGSSGTDTVIVRFDGVAVGTVNIASDSNLVSANPSGYWSSLQTFTAMITDDTSLPRIDITCSCVHGFVAVFNLTNGNVVIDPNSATHTLTASWSQPNWVFSGDVMTYSSPTQTSILPGWNLLGNSSNQVLTVSSPALYGDATRITSVWMWDASYANWRFYSPAMSFSDLQSYTSTMGYRVLNQINPGDGYWVNAKAAFSATLINGSGPEPAIATGWNLVATGNNVSPPAFIASHATVDVSSMWAWDNLTAKWYFYAPSLDASGSLDSYIASKGYLSFKNGGKKLGNGSGFWVNAVGPYAAFANISPTPSYSHPEIAAATFKSAMNMNAAGNVITTGMDGKKHIFLFPTLYYEDPLIPGIEFIEKENDIFDFVRFIDDVRMGNSRDWAQLNASGTKEQKYVIVDHGLETRTGYDTWPFGNVWIATDKGSGFQFQKISTSMAFNHSVAVGNISGSGRDDILVVNMGVKPGGIPSTLHHYMQNSDGTFVQNQNTFLSFGSSGAVAIADLNNDGVPDVIQGNYISMDSSDWGGFRIWSNGGVGEFKIASTFPREGGAVLMGITKIVAFDYDNDGLVDLLFSLEGPTPGSLVRYNAHSLELYRNKGNFRFERVTDRLFETSTWINTDLSFRELVVSDIDGDGYSDIILQGTGGSSFQNSPTWKQFNFGSLILKNANGTGFVSQKEIRGGAVTLKAFEDSPMYVRFKGMENGVLKMFGMTTYGAPMIFSIKASQ